MATLVGKVDSELKMAASILSGRLRPLAPPDTVVRQGIDDGNFFLDDDGIKRILALPVLALLDGYWMRAGRMRAKLLRQQRKAKLGDALIAQICLDCGAPLITHNGDFENFVDLGLKLL